MSDLVMLVCDWCGAVSLVSERDVAQMTGPAGERCDIVRGASTDEAERCGGWHSRVVYADGLWTTLPHPEPVGDRPTLDALYARGILKRSPLSTGAGRSA